MFPVGYYRGWRRGAHYTRLAAGVNTPPHKSFLARTTRRYHNAFMSTPRLIATLVVHAVLERGESLRAAWADDKHTLGVRDRALAQELIFGALRYGWRLDALINALVNKPLRDESVRAALWVGLYQLLYMRVPPHAAVAETVNVLRGLHKPWATGLVNALLRRTLREGAALLSQLDKVSSVRYAHPLWWLEALQESWPQDWERIAQANNAHAPLTLRVNRLQITRTAYMARLAAAEIEAVQALAEEAVTLITPQHVESLPGFGAGEICVQDAGAQWAATLLNPQPGERILDACCAPGGKTAHLLERAPTARVLALDNEARRLTRVTDTLARLSLHAECRVADAGAPATWWDGEYFDRILLDAPCSASGVIRRHPDIKYLRRPTDLPVLAQQQTRLLHALWPLLKPGGVLLYATCSVFPTENEERITHFLADTPDAAILPIVVPGARALPHGQQIFPGDLNMDGFYYALLTKTK